MLGGLAFAGLARPSFARAEEIVTPMRAALGRRWTPGEVDEARGLRMLFSTQAQLFRADGATVEAARLQALPLQTRDQRLYRANLIGLGGAYGFRQVEVVGLPAATTPLFHVHVPVLQDAPSLYDFPANRFVIGWDAASAADFSRIDMPSAGRGREPWMRLPAVDVELDGMRLRLQIDTASPYGVTLDPDAVDRLGLWGRWQGGYDRVADAERSADRGWAVQVRRAGALKLGDWTLDGPIVGLRGPRDAPRRVPGIDGLLGMDVLGRFAMGIEPDGWRLRLRPAAEPAAAFRHDRSGVQLAWRGGRDGRFEVVAVDPGSGAEAAGLKVGDVAHDLNAVQAETFEWAASDPTETSVRLTVVREGQPVPVAIDLKDRL